MCGGAYIMLGTEGLLPFAGCPPPRTIPLNGQMLGLVSCEPGHFSSLDPVFPGFVITFVGCS